MKKVISLGLLLIFSIAFSKITTAQPDSLVLFSDLSYHSKFEKEAFRNFTKQNIFEISDIDALMDTINNLEARYNLVMIKSILKEHKLRAYLQKADNLFLNDKIKEGDKFLGEFEKNCEAPVKSPILSPLVEHAYRKVAVYHFYKGRKSLAKSYIDRGLKYVPGSRLLESAVY